MEANRVYASDDENAIDIPSQPRNNNKPFSIPPTFYSNALHQSHHFTGAIRFSFDKIRYKSLGADQTIFIPSTWGSQGMFEMGNPLAREIEDC